MKILIVGSKGQLGRELAEILETGKADIGPVDVRYTGAEVLAADVDTLDITDAPALDVFISRHKPDVIFNCSAYTNVDKAEEEEESAFKINAEGCLNLALSAAKSGSKLLSVSTDYVFDGTADKPYAESDLPNPQNVYGKSKLLGERNIAEHMEKYFIVRTAWLYGMSGKNFVRTMLRLGAERDVITVVGDQFGSPTNANDLAFHMLSVALTENYGVYHCTGNGVCSWYDFAKRIIEKSGLRAKVVECTSAEYPSKVKRPPYSALENKRLSETVGDKMRDWKDAIDCFLAKIKAKESGAE